LCSNLRAFDVVKCIDSIPPSAELVPLICGLNPDFIWSTPFGSFPDEINKVLTWLKVSLTVPIYLSVFEVIYTRQFGLSLKIYSTVGKATNSRCCGTA
jgi:hypothetical protein